MPSHYETLGVSQTASREEIRSAYVALARDLHPDRQQGRDPAQTKRAADRMSSVNEAWGVLSNADRRRTYDGQEVRAGRGGQPTVVRTTSSAPTYMPPVDDEYVGTHTFANVLRGMPWLVVLVVLGGIFVLTAYATSGTPTPRPVEPIMRAEQGACFVFVEKGALPVSCATRSDGVVVERFADINAECPAATLSTYLAQELIKLCYTPR